MRAVSSLLPEKINFQKPLKPVSIKEHNLLQQKVMGACPAQQADLQVVVEIITRRRSEKSRHCRLFFYTLVCISTNQGEEFKK